MKNTATIPAYAISVLLFAQACASEVGLNDPPEGKQLSLAAARYSAWGDPKLLETVNLPDTNDQQPALSKDGLSLYFASTRKTGPSDPTPDLNIWVARRACTEECDWTAAQVAPGLDAEIPGVNTDFPDVSPTLSRDGNYLFFASQRPHSCYPPQTGQCTDRDFYVSYREDVQNDFGWGPAVNLGGGINSNLEEVAPSYFENADVGVPQLFFNRGALSGDIYMSQMEGGVWGPAVLVDKLNTPKLDQRPSISHDGLTIYFYSDRDPGPEGNPLVVNRLWAAQRRSVSDNWSVPQPVIFPTSEEQDALMPFIHSHGRTETLLFVRPFGLAARDLYMMERTRLDRPE